MGAKFHVVLLTAAAGLLAYLMCAPSHAEVKPKCLPNPTLACVTQAAVEALDAASISADFRPSESLESIARAARAQAKLGDAAGLERTLALLETTATEAKRTAGRQSGYVELQLAMILASVGHKREVREAIRKHIRMSSVPGRTFDVRWAKALIDVGLADEAQTLLAQHRDGFRHERSNIPPLTRVAYLLTLFKAHLDLGDTAAMTLVVRWFVDELLDLPIERSTDRGDFADNIVYAQAIASALLDRGHAELAQPFLGIANEYIARTPVPGQKLAMEGKSFANRVLALRRRIEYQRAFLAKEDELVRLSRRLFAEGRDIFEIRGERALVGAILLNDMFAAAKLKDSETVTVLADRATASLDENLDAKSDGAFFLTVALAVAGREEPVTRAIERANCSGNVKKLAEAACMAFARHGHIEPALRCAARLEGTRSCFRNRMHAVYGVIAESLSQK